jgi:septum formation protein
MRSKSLTNEPIILASESPRRAALLSLAGFNFTVRPSRLDEADFDEENPVAHVRTLSRLKAEKIADEVKKGLIVAADTIVVLDQRILGKPINALEAKNMLSALSGRTHEVYTGFTVVEQPGYRTVTEHEVTRVTFRALDEWEIDDYVCSGEPMDKAGAYGIQDQSAVFVDHIEGCFYNVVGFPLSKFFTALKRFKNR